MTPVQSTVRLVLYVAASMLSAAMAGFSTIDFSKREQVILFSMGVALAGINTARSYIDKSPAEVKGGEQ